MERISKVVRVPSVSVRIPLIFLLLGACGHLSAIDPDIRLDQLYHTRWTVKDGAPSGVLGITQSRDGFLWFGDTVGLYRFDGVQFERYDQPSDRGTRKPGGGVPFALPDGNILIGWWNGGASVLANERFTDYGPDSGYPPNRPIGWLQVGPQKTVWIFPDSRIMWLDHIGHWHGVPEWPIGATPFPAFWDRTGVMWVPAHTALYYREPGETKFHKMPTEALAVTETPDGKLWLQTSHAIRVLRRSGPGDAVVKLPAGQNFTWPYFFADHKGSLWAAIQGGGIVRYAHPELGLSRQTIRDDHFTVKDGLTSNIICSTFEDREGNIWIATALGVDLFRQSAIIPLRLPESQAFTFLKDGGQLYITSSSPSRIFTVKDAIMVRSNALAASIQAAYGSRRGALWLGGDGLFRYVNGQLEREEPPGPYIGAISEDDRGRLWVRVPLRGFFRRENGRWTGLAALGASPPPPQHGGQVFTDSLGRVWFVFDANCLYMLNGEIVAAFTKADGVATGALLEVGEAAGVIFIGGAAGLETFDGRKFIPVIPNDMGSFSDVWGLLGSPRSGIWFMEAHGIAHIPLAELGQLKNNPKHRVSYELFDGLDGLPSSLQRSGNMPSSIEDSEGRVWFATESDSVWIDPKRISHNRVAPGVIIQSIAANGKKYRPAFGLKLPPRTTAARISFTATSFTIPERVRFTYQMEGVDRGWQDFGTRREASYTNLAPGSYRFRVIACNNDGVWNETGAAADFTIAPTFYQTVWFKFLYALIGGGLLWGVYRLRLRQIAAAMSARFDERMGERMRIARDIHDTLLQTLQGAKMVADNAISEDNDLSQVKRAMVLLAGWLSQAIQEGREALSSLRNSTTEDNDLSAALRRAIEESRLQRPIEFDLSVEGSSKRMHPIARDEIYQIGYEAIRNAFTHSGATHLDVKVSYLRDLVLQVQDDGTGFESSSMNTETGRGHFGLIGMYERAARIRAKLTISSSPRGGTRVELVVPGRVAFIDRESAGKRPT